MYPRQVQLRSVEKLDLVSAGVSGLTLRFEAADVAAITAGSDFDRSTLGLGLSGTGNVLFVDPGPNGIDLAGWTLLGPAVVDGVDRQVHQNGTSILALLAVTNLTLVGTSAAETLTGLAGDDVISGGGGADTLIGGLGADRITQRASETNGAAGSRLDGGAGADTLIFQGVQAYTSNYVRLNGGDGDDLIQVGRIGRMSARSRSTAAPGRT
jgi:Ca2+-binding RTX toxin-like protein